MNWALSKTFESWKHVFSNNTIYVYKIHDNSAILTITENSATSNINTDKFTLTRVPLSEPWRANLFLKMETKHSPKKYMIKKDENKEPDSDYCHGNWHKSKGISNNSQG